MSEVNVGDRFGKLVVLEIQTTDDYKKIATCECDCGCLVNVGIFNPRWKGCGELPSKYFSRLLYESKKYGRECDVTIEYLWDLFLQQGRRCFYSGVPLQFLGEDGTISRTASLDRTDSKGIYVAGNVQWIHKDLQFMKNDFTEERFLELCRLVYQTNCVLPKKVA